MEKKVLVLLTVILTAFSISSLNNQTNPTYYDIVFLCGLDDEIYRYDIIDNQLREITSSQNLRYLYCRGSDLPRIRANMLVLYAHGNPNQTEINSTIYSNQEMFDFFSRIKLNFLVSESCFSGRFFALPETISVLASSNDTGSSLAMSITCHNGNCSDPEFAWGMLPFFLDHFSFNLTSAYLDIINDLKGWSVNQTIWTRTNSVTLSAYMG